MIYLILLLSLIVPKANLLKPISVARDTLEYLDSKLEKSGVNEVRYVEIFIYYNNNFETDQRSTTSITSICQTDKGQMVITYKTFGGMRLDYYELLYDYQDMLEQRYKCKTKIQSNFTYPNYW